MKVYLFACIEKNIGDDLFIKILCDRYPNVDFVISSKAKYGSLLKIPNLKFSDKLEKWNWLSSLGQNSKIKALVSKILQFIYTIMLPKYDVAVCIVGNAFKNQEYKGWKQSRWIRERVKLADRFYLLSTNFGPYNDPRWKDDFNKIFLSMFDVCFRDRFSYDLFSACSNVRYAPDAVFTFGKKEHEENKNVIISLIDCSFEARGEKLRNSVSIYEQKMVETINYLNLKGYKVILLNSNAEQDRPACNRILAELEPESVSTFDYNGNLNEIFELYERSSFVIGTRLHTIVLGWLYGMQVLPIIYDIKVSNLLKTCLYDGDFLNITKLDLVSAEEIFKKLMKNKYNVPKNVLEDAHKQFLQLDKELLGRKAEE